MDQLRKFRIIASPKPQNKLKNKGLENVSRASPHGGGGSYFSLDLPTIWPHKTEQFYRSPIQTSDPLWWMVLKCIHQQKVLQLRFSRLPSRESIFRRRIGHLYEDYMRIIWGLYRFVLPIKKMLQHAPNSPHNVLDGVWQSAQVVGSTWQSVQVVGQYLTVRPCRLLDSAWHFS